MSYKLEALRVVSAVMRGWTTPIEISESLQKLPKTVRSHISKLVDQGILTRNNGVIEVNYPVFIEWFLVQIDFMENYAEAISLQNEMMGKGRL